MTEEFDEDVVFENSPLFQYLHDLGHTDFEACPTGSQEEGCGGDGEEAPPLGDSQKRSGGHLWRLANALWRWSPIGKAATCHSLERELDCVFGQYSVRCILDQDVLLQEDVELIELLDPGLLTLGSPADGSPGSAAAAALPRPGLLASPSLWDVAGLVGLAAVLLGLCSATGGGGGGGPWSLAATVPCGLALLGWVGARGARLWRRGRAQRAVHATASELQALVHDSKALTGVARKALRLVQETEVISRGFTLVSAASSFSRAGLGAEPRGQQLIGLRKALYRALRTAFRASRRATCHMLKSFPLNSEIDNVTNYVSAVPLKELGLGLGVEHVGDEQAQEFTDDYSLPALKVMYQLWVAQSSECFRRLALLLSSRQREAQEPVGAAGTSVAASSASASTGPKSPCATPAALHRSITAVTEPLHHALAGCLGEVQRSYDFHRYFETQPRGQGSDRAGQARQKCRELNTLHTSIRSLQLHLKALLSEMIILEDDLEKMMVCGETTTTTAAAPPLSGEGYLELSQRLHNLQPHMQASASCWEDTVGQVDRMLRRTDNAAGVRQGAPAAAPVPTPTPSFPLILDRDPVPEELEWEAYVSESDSEEEGRGGSWCDMLSPEERERQRREREESRRVLSELKAVLGFRASEGERLKWKQLLFNDQAATTPLTREDSSGAAPPSSSSPAGPSQALEGTGLAVPPGASTSNHNDKDHGSEDKDDETEEEKEEEEKVPVTEFTCGLDKMAAEEGEERHVEGAGGSELYQYDGLPLGDGGDGEVLDCFLKPRVTALSTVDRLTELHGAEALSISSALAAQVAARSHALVHMEEQTFGDEDEDDDEGGECEDCNDTAVQEKN